MKKSVSLLLTLCLILSLFSGCSAHKGSFTYYLKNNVRSLDPQTANGTYAATVINAIFDGLCRIDENGEAVPAAAESWTADSSSTVFTFTLDEDATWSNGEPVTAYDFVYGIQRALSPATGADNVDELFIISGAREAYYGLADVSTVGVSATNDTTLVFKLTGSCPNFPKLTAGVRFMPCNEEFFKSTTGRYGLGSSYLITNGPFTFSSNYSWTDGVSIELAAYDDYNGKVKPASLTFYLGESDDITEDPITALTNGTTDVLQLDNATLASEAEAAGCTVSTFTNKTTGILFNSESTELTTRLREIFVKAIDRDALSAALSEGTQIADDIIPSGLLFNGSDYRSNAESSLYVKQDTSVYDYQNYQSTVKNEVTTENNSEENSDDEGDNSSDSVTIVDNTSDNLQVTTVSTSDEYLEESRDEEISYIPSITIICLDDYQSTAIANSVISDWNKFDSCYCNIKPLSEDDFYQAISDKNYDVALYTIESSSDTALSMLESFESTASPQLLDSVAFDTLMHSGGGSISDITNLEKFLNNQFIFYPICYDASYYAAAPSIKNVMVNIGTADFTKASK